MINTSIMSKTSIRLKNIYGGGELDYSITGPNDLSVIYKNNQGQMESRFDIKNKKKFWATKQNPSGELMDMEKHDLANMFEQHVLKDMLNHYENHVTNQDPEERRVLDLTRKINNMKESSENIMSDMRETLKPFMDKIHKILDEMDNQELEEASNGSMSAMPGKTYSPPPQNKALAKINAITKR